MKRFRRVRALLLVAAAATLLPASNALAQTEAARFGGYQGSAAASGVHIRYVLENFLPIGPPLDLGVPDALATISTGPTTFARSSVADPGDVLANPGALLSQASPDYEPGTIPPYPYRIEANSSIGEPTAENSPGPGLESRVRADGSGSRAESRMPALSAPPVITAGSMTADAETVYEASSISVHARSELSQLDLLGIVKIESVVTDLSATTEGGETELSGGTTVTGAEVLGTPISIGADGVRLGNESGAGAIRLDALNEVLHDLGVRLTVAGPVAQAGGSAGQIASTGLRIDLEISDRTLPALRTIGEVASVLDTVLPDLGLGTATGVTGIRHLLSIEVGRAAVSLHAQPAATFEAPAPTVVSDTPPAAAPSLEAAAPAAPATPTTPPRGAASVPEPPKPAAIEPVATESPTAPLSTGIGVIALLALLAQPVIGSRLGAGSAAVLAQQESIACPREGR